MKFGQMLKLLCGLVWIVAAAYVLPVPVCARGSSSAPQDAVPTSSFQTPTDPRENLSSLLANPFVMPPSAPVVLVSEKEAGYTRELVRVQWRLGDPIELWILRPNGVSRPPVILYLYSYPSDTDRFRDGGYAERVTRGGYAAVGFVSALTGPRYHGVPMKEWFVSDLPEVLVESAHDVQMILNYLSTRGDMDMRRVGMYGQGSGGTIAVLAAAADPRIKVLNLLDPWGDWRDWTAKSIRVPEKERPNYVRKQFLKTVEPFDSVRWLSRLKGRNIRIQDVATDGITPAACQKKIEAAGRHAGAVIVKYSNLEDMLVAATDGKAFQWVKDQIKSAPEPTAAAAE